MNYIAEANRFMYDDNYITEEKLKIDGKEYPSVNQARAHLKSIGLKSDDINRRILNARNEKASASRAIKPSSLSHQNYIKHIVELMNQGYSHSATFDDDIPEDKAKEEIEQIKNKMRSYSGTLKDAQVLYDPDAKSIEIVFKKDYSHVVSNFLSDLYDIGMKSTSLKELTDGYKLDHFKEKKTDAGKTSKASYKTVKDVTSELGARGAVSRIAVIKFLKSNDLNDELQASVIGYYGIDGEELFDDDGNWR